METYSVPVENPEPDFDRFKSVLLGEQKAERVHFAELIIDWDIEKYLSEKYLDILYPAPDENMEEYCRRRINLWQHLGFDYVRVAGALDGQFAVKNRVTADTAGLSGGDRSWVEEGTGVIQDWEDFEKYPWPDASCFDYSPFECSSKHLPDGMKMMVCPSSGVFEIASEKLLGFENMSYLVVDNFDLLEAVFNRVGKIICEFYENIADMDNVEGFFQGDDLGFKTSTFLSPPHIRDLVLPWHKKYAEIAHKHRGMYWLHSCGKIFDVVDDFIDDAGIDAFHSFQDEIMPVWEFKHRYGDRIAVLGGADVGKVCRLDEPELRAYVRKILAGCMPERFALGTGNSVANYIPPENYLIMLDEAMKWG